MPDTNTMLIWLFPAVLSSSSNGHRCLSLMLQTLVTQGISCGVVVQSPSRFYQLSTLKIPEIVPVLKPNQIPSRTISVIATDTSDASLVSELRIKQHHIIWWLMAPPVILGTPFPPISALDQVLCYSAFILPGLQDYYFVQDPSTFRQLQERYDKLRLANNQSNQRAQSRIGIYCGKGRLTKLPKHLEQHLKTTTLVPFSRYWPQCQEDYSQLILSLDALISYDPLTAVNLDVACQGKPVFLPSDPFDSQAYSSFPLSCLRNIYHSSHEFIDALARTNNVSSTLEQTIHETAAINVYSSKAFAAVILDVQAKTKALNTDLVSRLEHYSKRIAETSTIQPYLDGQAASSTFLDLYILYIKSRTASQKIFEYPLRFLLITSDYVIATHLGRKTYMLSVAILRRVAYSCFKLKCFVLRVPYKLKSVLFGAV